MGAREEQLSGGISVRPTFVGRSGCLAQALAPKATKKVVRGRTTYEEYAAGPSS